MSHMVKQEDAKDRAATVTFIVPAIHITVFNMVRALQGQNYGILKTCFISIKYKNNGYDTHNQMTY